MGFAVLHIAKGKGAGAGLGRHLNKRETVVNSDPARHHLNYFVTHNAEGKILKRPPSEIPLQQRIQDRIDSGYTGKTAIRKDAVKFLNIVLSGSHEDMKEIESKGRINEWAAKNYVFMAKKYGPQNIIEFAVHLDERTPHAHAVVVPLTNDGRLTAKEVMGNKVQLSQLQEDYGQLMYNDFKLNRGVKGSKAKHDTLQEYYGRINERMNTTPQPPNMQHRPNVNFQLQPPPRVCLNPEEWAMKQSAAIQQQITGQVMASFDKIHQEARRSWEDWKVKFMIEAENASRSRKQLAQFAGALKAKEVELDKKLNPEKYINRSQQRQQSQGGGVGL